MKDWEKYKDLKVDDPNWISEYDKIYVLPTLIQNVAIVRLIITVRSHVTVISEHYPIRHGKNWGGKVFLGDDRNIDLTPSFIWNGKEWMISTSGTFLFAEIEINTPPTKGD